MAAPPYIFKCMNIITTGALRPEVGRCKSAGPTGFPTGQTRHISCNKERSGTGLRQDVTVFGWYRTANAHVLRPSSARPFSSTWSHRRHQMLHRGSLRIRCCCGPAVRVQAPAPDKSASPAALVAVPSRNDRHRTNIRIRHCPTFAGYQNVPDQKWHRQQPACRFASNTVCFPHSLAAD